MRCAWGSSSRLTAGFNAACLNPRLLPHTALLYSPPSASSRLEALKQPDGRQAAVLSRPSSAPLSQSASFRRTPRFFFAAFSPARSSAPPPDGGENGARARHPHPKKISRERRPTLTLHFVNSREKVIAAHLGSSRENGASCHCRKWRPPVLLPRASSRELSRELGLMAAPCQLPASARPLCGTVCWRRFFPLKIAPYRENPPFPQDLSCCCPSSALWRGIPPPLHALHPLLPMH